MARSDHPPLVLWNRWFIRSARVVSTDRPVAARSRTKRARARPLAGEAHGLASSKTPLRLHTSADPPCRVARRGARPPLPTIPRPRGQLLAVARNSSQVPSSLAAQACSLRARVVDHCELSIRRPHGTVVRRSPNHAGGIELVDSIGQSGEATSLSLRRVREVGGRRCRPRR